MNNLKNYFSSPEKSPPVAVTTPKNQGSVGAIETTELSSKISNNSFSPIASTSATSPFPYVVKTPRADSKLILQNMEEVLNSVKKKHRHKHRRKREQKKRAQMQSAELGKNSTATESSSSCTGSNGWRKGENDPVKNEDKLLKTSKKSPLQESTDQSTDQLSTVPKTAENALIKNKGNTQNSKSSSKKQTNSNEKSESKSLKPNAFEVMMNARNRSIGSNTSGKDEMIIEDESKVISVSLKEKRKIFLEEWAEKKGSKKRKLDDEARQAYIEKKLGRRAKKLKEMLTNGSSMSDSHAPSDQIPSPVADIAKDKIKPKTSVSVTKAKRPNGRSKRVNIPDSSDDSDKKEMILDEGSSAEFLSKLSSPVKRKDSLLGYFPKKDEIKESAITVNEKQETQVGISQSKKRVKQQKNLTISTGAIISDDKASTEPNTCSRPKRSCSRRVRYSSDLIDSPEKDQRKLFSSKIRQNSLNEEYRSTAKSPAIDDYVIDIDELPNQIKLAPLFIRSMPKPNINPEIIAARKQFLMSGVPEKMRLEIDKQKQFEQTFEKSFELFPKVSHVIQLSESEKKFLTTKIDWPLNQFRKDTETCSSPTTPLRRSKFKSNRLFLGSITTCTTKDFRLSSNVRIDCGGKQKNQPSNVTTTTPLLPHIENKRRIIKSWKINFDRFPTFKCYNQMREKYRYFCAIDSAQDTQQVTESLVVTRKSHRPNIETKKFDPDAEDDKPPQSAPNGELLFTEKYKPLLSEQVLVNLTPVNQLRDFLSNWNCNYNNSQRVTTTNESQQEFNDSNSTNNLSTSVVLLGPGSSGKTNAVFAVANEMNFNVLEVNAGMKRTGKKLLQELQEATQSHQIRKESGKNSIKFSLNGKKTNTDADSIPLQNDSSHSVRKSLILIEDADILFDQYDAGFIDALYTLAATSKRPVIIVASNPNCQHLQRLFQQNKIKFSQANSLNISKFLSVLSLIENCPIELKNLLNLYMYNRKDLRKTILEIQFYIQSGGDRKRHSTKTKDIFVQQQPSKFYASPNKLSYAEETTTSNHQINSEHDDELIKKQSKKFNDDDDEIYVHHGLFEFYTVSQNFLYRIPYPIDFSLLRENLSILLRNARNLQTEQSTNNNNMPSSRRKSRSPKKAWLNAANQSQPLQSLCNFYDNISIAAMLCPNDCDDTLVVDRLVPRLSEEISQSIVERAINTDLASGYSPYNLFKIPNESFTILNNQSPALRTQSAISLDYEPTLRSICRSEKIRYTTERRGTRFYHYLRNYSTNQNYFSKEYFDKFCSILSEQNVTEEGGGGILQQENE